MMYEKLREEYLDKLKTTKEVLAEVDKFEKYNLFNSEELKELKKIQERSEFFYDKLEKGEIEVAIVGMENSGKSTFANAFVKIKEAFPTGSIRTTFTSTKMKYGKEDKAIVEFFTKQEFDEIFNELLDKVKYPNKTSFYELNIDTYKMYFESLRDTYPEIYKVYKATINKDIIDILEGADVIKKYLNHPPKEFNKFQIENEELKQFITDKYIARTAKKVEIESSEFEEVKEMVLYDVPGFNSTTQKHKIETTKALNRADAIILVKNVVENSELTGEELSILDSYDETGISLKEKLFVAGTKIDRANSKEELLNVNIPTLKTNMKNNLNLDENRIFLGSPFAYLNVINLSSKGEKAVQTLKEWGMEDAIYSVEKLKEAIKDFYKNEAFDNIQRQINMLIAKLKEILQNVVIDGNVEKRLQDLAVINDDVAMELLEEFHINLRESLSPLHQEKNKIYEEKPFSNTLKEKIDLKINVNEEYIKKINLESNTNSLEVETPENTNYAARNNLTPQIQTTFVNELINIAQDKHQEYFDKVIDLILLNILKIDQNNKYFDEIRESLINTIKDINESLLYDEKSYIYLIERFTVPIMEVVLKNPRGSQGRLNAFKANKNDLILLALNYQDTVTINILELDLIKKILNLKIQQQNNEIELGEFSFLLDNPEFKEFYHKTLKNYKKEDILEILVELYPTSKTNLKFLIKHILKDLENYEKQNINEKDEIERIYDYNQSKNLDEVIEEILSDIDLTKDILKNSVVKVLNLERPFVSSFMKFLDNLYSNDSSPKWREFIKTNKYKIKYKELQNVEAEKVKLTQQKEIISQIQNLLTKI